MEWKDVLPVLAGGLVILVVALVVKPLLLGEPLGLASPWPVRMQQPPAYIPPAPVPTPTPFSDDGEVYTRNFRWTAIDGGVQTTQIRVPEALFLAHREAPQFTDALAWGRYPPADADRPVLEDLAGRIAPPARGPDEEYFRLMNVVFFVQQIPYEPDNSTDSYIEGVIPRRAVRQGEDVGYSKAPVEMLVDGRGDCEDAAILMAGLLDALGYDTVLLLYSDHMALGIRMNEFNPYYARYTPKYFEHEGKHYYYVEGTNYTTVSSGNSTYWAKPSPIGNTQDISIPSVKSETPKIIPLRYIPEPAEYRIRPVRLPAGGA